MQNRYSRGSTVRFFLDVIAAGAGVISLSPTIAIQRRADGAWFNVADGLWVPTKVENLMTQTDSVNLPGRYHFDFDQTLDLLSGSSEYVVKKSSAAGTLALEYEDAFFAPLAAVNGIGLCSIQGTIFDPQGSPVSNELIRATLVPILKDSLGRGIQSDQTVVGYSNQLGDFDLPLVRGGTFRLEIPAIGYDRKIVVPDQASVLFSAL